MEEKTVNKSNTPKIILYILAVIVLLGVGFASGFYTGKKNGEKMINKEIAQKSEEYKKIVDIAYPKPPDEIFEISGRVISKGDDYVVINTIDPDDYLPHPDNSPRKMLERKVKVDKNTNIIFVDLTKMNPDGTAFASKTSLNSINVNDLITVRSNDNIKYATEFTATEIIKSSF